MAIKIAGTEVISDDKRILNNESLPDIRPSLLLDFANSKTLDPRITFTRGSTATYWDGKTTAKAEENLVGYSNFDNPYWQSVRADITGSATTAPDGTTTGVAVNQASGQTNFGRYYRSSNIVTPINNADYTWSVYLKTNGKQYGVLGTAKWIGGAYSYTWFDLVNGTIGSVDSAHTATITDVGNGWYRCSITTTANNPSGAGEEVSVNLADANNTSTVTDDQQGIYVWGAQLEQRSSATAYTPTTTSPIVKYQPVLQTAASGEARFDHSPTTGESKGLLIEESRTNLLTRSEEFDHAEWSTVKSTVTVDSIAAPDGTLTGAKITSDTTSGEHYFSDSLSQATGTFTDSVFAKQGGYTNIILRPIHIGADEGGSQNVRFDLNAGTVLSATPSATGTITDVGNGWYRCSVTYTVTGTLSGTYGFRIQLYDNSSTVFTGDGTSGVYIWGAQREAGSFPTSYIPTSGSTVTRAADDAYIDGADFSNFYSAGQGTLYAEYLGSQDTFCGIAALQSTFNTGNSRISLLQISAILAEALVSNSGTTQAQLYEQTVVEGLLSKVVVSYVENDVGASFNNSVETTDTSATIPSDITALRIGGLGGGNSLNSTIKKIAFYPKRLPNATLQAMTEE